MKNATLLSVLIFARHGDRTPSIPIDEDFWKTKLPKSPILPSYIDEDSIFSQLTSKGLLDMIKLGQNLRISYPQFDSSQIKFYSTDYDRTRHSSKAVSTSFPLSNKNNIHFLPKSIDKFFDPWSSIPAFGVAVNNFFTINKNVEMEQIVKKFQVSLKKPNLSLIEIYDMFICNESHKEDAPPIDVELEQFREIIKVETNLQYRALYCDLTIRKYAVGYLAKAIGNYFESQISTSSAKTSNPYSYFDPKASFSFIACHDLNIVPLQKFFFEEQEDTMLTWPKYGYQLIFELYSNGMIRIFDSDLKLNKVLSMNDLLTLIDTNMVVVHDTS